MALEKEWKEFHTVDLTKGWEVPLGYPSGIQQQILAGKLDEKINAVPEHGTYVSIPAFIQPFHLSMTTGKKYIYYQVI